MATHSQELAINRPVPIRKQVYHFLRSRILDQTIVPSTRLVEAKIAEQLGISRTPVREALHLLEKDGFVRSIPRVGYAVKNLAWDELEEIVEIRRVNESLACRWAIRKIDAQTLEMLEDNLARTEQLLRKGSPEHFLSLDEEFHEMLVRASGSHHLFELCQQLRRLMVRYRAESLKSKRTVEAALRGHRRIVSSLKSGDARMLEDALADHLDYSKDDVRRTMQQKPPGA